MGNSKPRYAAEFKRKLVELARSGSSLSALSREFGPHETTIAGWVKQAARDEGVGDGGLTTDEKDEIRRLRRENKRLRQERDILAKATAWFARETETVPGKPTK